MKLPFFLAMLTLSPHAIASDALPSIAGVANCSVAPKKCEATGTLKRVFEVCELTSSTTFTGLVDQSQNTWKRPKGLERWQIQEKHAHKREELMALFEALGFNAALHAKNSRYDYGVIFGATLQRTRSRINWLIQEWILGVRFDEIVFLSGDRTLDNALELSELHQLWRCCEVIPATEIEMINWLWRRMDIPEAMRKLPFTLINASASDWRAHTGDTIHNWIAKSPKAGSVLAVSNQPYVSYQDMSLRRRLPSTFTIETIGEAASKEDMNSVYLDNLSRLLFELRNWEAAS